MPGFVAWGAVLLPRLILVVAVIVGVWQDKCCYTGSLILALVSN